jgi:hypothetical protein
MKYSTTVNMVLIVTCMVSGLFIYACESQLGDQENRKKIASAAEMQGANEEVDEPDGFEVDILAPHAPFTDELSALFRLKFAEGGDETIVNNFRDASTMIFAEVDWEETGSSSGWHLHPGVALVTMTKGEIEVTWDRDCVPRTYTAGDGWLDPGDIHTAEAISDGAKAYVVFLGIPDGEPATEWVEPPEC